MALNFLNNAEVKGTLDVSTSATIGTDLTLTDGVLTVNDGNNYVKISEGTNSIGEIELKDSTAVYLQGWGTDFRVAVNGTYDNHALKISAAKESTFYGNVVLEKSTPTLTFNNLAGGGLDPILQASGTDFNISTTSIVPLSIDLSTGHATFNNEITSGDDINCPTKVVIGNDSAATPELRIKKSDAGYGKVSWYNDDGSGSAQAGYISLDNDENLYYYMPANKSHIFYGSASERFQIGGDVAVKGTTDFSIPSGRKFYLDGQSDTYITESSDGVIDFYGDSTFLVSMKQNGTQSEVVVNEGSGDVDFRVEANNDTHAFFVVAEGTGKVGIGTASPSSYNSRGQDLVIKKTGQDVGISIVAEASGGTEYSSSVIFADGTGGTAGYRGIIEYDHDKDIMAFSTSATEAVSITSTGDLSLSSGNALKFADDKVRIGDQAGSTLGAEAVSIGYDADAEGDQSIAIGYNPQATGDQSIAIGYNCSATGQYSQAYGYNVDATGIGTMIFGQSGSSSAANTFVVSGLDLQLTGYGSGTVTGTAAYTLAVDSSGNVIETSSSGGGVTGSGTANYIPMWSTSTQLTDSIMLYDTTGNDQIRIVAGNPELRLQDSDNSMGMNLSFNGNHGELHNTTNNGNIELTTEGSGGVGINTSGTVGSALDVNGTVRVRNQLNVGETTEQNLFVAGGSLTDGGERYAKLGYYGAAELLTPGGTQSSQLADTKRTTAAYGTSGKLLEDIQYVVIKVEPNGFVNRDGNNASNRSAIQVVGKYGPNTIIVLDHVTVWKTAQGGGSGFSSWIQGDYGGIPAYQVVQYESEATQRASGQVSVQWTYPAALANYQGQFAYTRPAFVGQGTERPAGQPYAIINNKIARMDRGLWIQTYYNYTTPRQNSIHYIRLAYRVFRRGTDFVNATALSVTGGGDNGPGPGGTLTSFTRTTSTAVFNDVCSATGSATAYHNGSGTYPVGGDNVYTSSNGSAFLAGGYYKIAAANTWFRITGGSGEVSATGSC